MGREYTSLEGLVFREYGSGMPVRMPGTLRNSVWLTVVIEFAILGLFAVVPHEVWLVRLERDEFFTLQLFIDLSNFVFNLGNVVMPYLMGLNLVSLLLALIIITVTVGMGRRVKRGIHLLATINLFPTGITIGLATVVAAVLGVSIVIHSALCFIGVFINILIMLALVAGFWGLVRRR